MNKLFLTLAAAALTLAACAPAASSAPAATAPPASATGSRGAASTPVPDAAAYLTLDFPDAASLRNQLAFGTLNLEGTPESVTPAQAQALLPSGRPSSP